MTFSSARVESEPPVAGRKQKDKRGSFVSKKGLSFLRFAVQISFVAFIAYVSIRHMVFGGGPDGGPPLHAYCPFGGLETLYRSITEGVFLKKTRSSNLALFGSIVFVTLIAGRGFCGWICPFGSITEWLGNLGKKASLTVRDIPPAVDAILRSLKYLVLVVVLSGTYATGRMVFADYDPYPALFHFGVWAEISSAALIILAATLLLSIFVERAWCRYACPLGAIMAVLAKVSLVRVKSIESSCKGCAGCSDLNCPMGINRLQINKTNSECIMCLRCVEGCKHGSIQLTA